MRGADSGASTAAPPSADRSADAAPRRAAWCGLALAAAVVAAAGLRFVRLGDQEFWLDELHSMLNSAAHRARFESLPVGRIIEGVPRLADLAPDSTADAVWRDLRRDAHPPLYFILLHGWRRVFGDSELSVRVPSAACSALSLLPMGLMACEFGRRRAAVGAALLGAVAFAHLNTGQQARPYGLAMLLVATGFWLLVRMERRWSRLGPGLRFVHVAGHATTLCLAMLTHYFAGLALAAQAVYAARRCRGRLPGWLCCGGAAAVAAYALVWLPSFVAQLDFIGSQDWVRDPAPDHVRRTVLRALGLPVRLLFARPLPDWSGRMMELEALTGGLTLLAVLIAARRGRADEALPFALWYLVPAGALFIIDLATGKELLTHLRYPAVAAPGLAGLLAVAVDRLRPRLAVACAVALALIFAVTTPLPATDNPHARGAARLLATRMQAGDLLVFDATGWIPYWPRRDLLTVGYYLPPVDVDVLMLSGPPEPDVLARIQRYERVFCVSPRTDAIPNPSPETHPRVERSDYLYGVGWVYRFGRDGPGSRE